MRGQIEPSSVVREEIAYNLKFHELTVKDEGDNSESTFLFENVFSFRLDDVKIKDDINQDASFYKFSFSKATNEFIIFSEDGIILFKLANLGSKLKPSVSQARFIPFDNFVDHLIFIDHP